MDRKTEWKIYSDEIKSYVPPQIEYSAQKAMQRPKGKKSFKKLSVCAIIFTVIISSLFMIGFDNVVAAVGNLFGYVPGYTIVDDGSIISMLYEPVTAENDKGILTVTGVITTEKNIMVSCTVTLKNDNISTYEEIIDMQLDEQLARNNFYLYIDDNKIEWNDGNLGRNIGTYSSRVSFPLDNQNINENSVLKFEHEMTGISLEFRLKNLDLYEKLEDIGPTSSNNDISIVIVPAFDENTLEVNLYRVNKSIYNVIDFNNRDRICLNDNLSIVNKDITLETDSGIKTYTTDWERDDTFIFEIQPDDKEFTLTIPNITVESFRENKELKLNIPEYGEKNTINKKLKFKDCTVTIVDVERISMPTGWRANGENNGFLKMTLEYEHKYENKIVKYIEPIRILDIAFYESIGLSKKVAKASVQLDKESNLKSRFRHAYERDENGMATTLYLEIPHGYNEKKLKVALQPIYYLTDEYTFTFNR